MPSRVRTKQRRNTREWGAGPSAYRRVDGARDDGAARPLGAARSENPSSRPAGLLIAKPRFPR
eukprot:scaffold114047_cov22-Tisochrysis_lutea.AAC.1